MLSSGSFFIAGFECSSHRRGDRQRLDLIAATGHDTHCRQDYELVARHGMKSARDGFRWHLIERQRGKYDWSSILPMLRAARAAGMSVIWDLCHYGYPDWCDPWSREFCDAFASFALSAADLIREVSGEPPQLCVVNELSFWSWCGAQEGYINPFATERAGEFKRQLARASIMAARAIRERHPRSLLISAEPLINIVRDSNEPEDIEVAERYHRAQYEAADMLLGRRDPDLGGFDAALDVIGVNYYPHNQWRLRGGFVPLGHHDYRPLRELLAEAHARYDKPLMIAETGSEYTARPVWLSYVCREVYAAMLAGVPIAGICIYPITNYCGWDNDRLCHAGLFSTPDESGRRTPEPDYLDELKVWMARFAKLITQAQIATAAIPNATQVGA